MAQLLATDELLPTDNMLGGVDYSIPYAQSYAWETDGGSYLMETSASLRHHFDDEVFGDKRFGWMHLYDKTDVFSYDVAKKRKLNLVWCDGGEVIFFKLC